MDQGGAAREERVVLVTNLAPEECHDRLKRHLAAWYYMPTQRDLREGGRVLGGRVSSRGFSVYKKDNTRNSFRPVASGTFTPIPEGTRVEVWVGTPLWARLFMLWWLAFVAFGAILGILWSAIPSLIPVVMFGIGIGLYIYSSASSRDQRPYLLDLLARVLEAERVEPGNR